LRGGAASLGRRGGFGAQERQKRNRVVQEASHRRPGFADKAIGRFPCRIDDLMENKGIKGVVLAHLGAH
jgi:hypothetical protein